MNDLRRTTVSERQLRALHRVVSSMNLAGARISVTGQEDLLSDNEMHSLQVRLGAPLLAEQCDPPYAELEVS